MYKGIVDKQALCKFTLEPMLIPDILTFSPSYPQQVSNEYLGALLCIGISKYFKGKTLD
jgi:hypothetical protein